MTKTINWKAIPVQNEIISILIKNRGEILTTDLLRQLNLIYNDITIVDLRKILFKLEVRSFIHVIDIKKNVYKIEFNRYAHFSDSVLRQIKEFKY
ncbi:MAG: hypothetical protein ACTSVU_07365 [Promethearchaeota archaeon]